MKVEQFKSEHLDRMATASEFVEDLSLAMEHAASLETAGPALSGIRDDGSVVASAGFIQIYPHRFIGWAAMPCRLPLSELRFVCRRIRNWLEAQDRPIRVEAMVRSDFDGGRRLVRHLGFEFEGTMRAWGPNAEAFDLYAWVRL